MTVFGEISVVVDEIRKSHRVDVLFSRNDLAKDGDLGIAAEYVEGIIGLRIPSSIGQSMEIVGELRILWQEKGSSSAGAAIGEFFLRPVLVFGATNTLPEVYQEQSHDILDLRDVRVFDFYAYNGGPIHALLSVEGVELKEQVFIFNEREVWRTSMDVTAYLHELRRTRGFLYWQYLFCHDKRLEEPEAQAIARGLRFLESGFHEECADLWQRLEALKRAT